MHRNAFITARSHTAALLIWKRSTTYPDFGKYICTTTLLHVFVCVFDCFLQLLVAVPVAWLPVGVGRTRGRGFKYALQLSLNFVAI